jgi:hypothetical protein
MSRISPLGLRSFLLTAGAWRAGSVTNERRESVGSGLSFPDPSLPDRELTLFLAL